MERTVIVAVVALSLVVAVSAFAAQDSQPPVTTAPDFEQMKADHLKKLDDRMTSLQQEKVCVQAAKNQEELRSCRAAHKTDMKGSRDEMRKMRGHGAHGVPGVETAPQVK